MTIQGGIEERNKTKEYYDPDIDFEGLVLKAMYPPCPKLMPLLGKIIVSTPPKPVDDSTVNEQPLVAKKIKISISNELRKDRSASSANQSHLLKSVTTNHSSAKLTTLSASRKKITTPISTNSPGVKSRITMDVNQLTNNTTSETIRNVNATTSSTPAHRRALPSGKPMDVRKAVITSRIGFPMTRTSSQITLENALPSTANVTHVSLIDTSATAKNTNTKDNISNDTSAVPSTSFVQNNEQTSDEKTKQKHVNDQAGLQSNSQRSDVPLYFDPDKILQRRRMIEAAFRIHQPSQTTGDISEKPASSSNTPPKRQAPTGLTPEEQGSQVNHTGKKRRTLPKNQELHNKFEPAVLLSPEQQAIHDLVTKSNKNVFFTGAAGTGKSILLKGKVLLRNNPFGDSYGYTTI